MKNIIISFLLVTFTTGFAQQKQYFDKDWEKTTKGNASYYRIVNKKSNNQFLILDYFIDGTLQMKGVSSKKDKDIFEGTVYWYDKYARLEISREYKQGELNGKTIYYTTDEKVIASGVFKDDEPFDGIFREYEDFSIRPSFIPDYDEQKISYLEYEKGQEVSTIFYYKNSNRIAQKKVAINDGKNQNKWIFYDKNGNEIGHVFFGNTSSWKKNGTMVLFYIEDYQIIAIKLKRDYVDSIPTNEITYKKEGSIWFTGSYKKGEKYHGEFLDGYHLTFNKGVLMKVVYYDDTYNTIMGQLTFKDGEPYDGLYGEGYKETYYVEGKIVKIKEYFQDSSENLKSEEIFLNDTESEKKWYNSKGEYLGTGYYEDTVIINGLDINREHTIFTNNKNIRKQGIEKEYSVVDSDFLLRKTMYQNDSIVWSDIIHPLKQNRMLHLLYKRNKPFNGEEFRPDTDAFSDYIYKKYKNGRVFKIMIYDNEYISDTRDVTESIEDEEVVVESTKSEETKKVFNLGKCYRKTYHLTDFKYEPNYLCFRKEITYDSTGNKLSLTIYYNHKAYIIKYKNGREYNGTTIEEKTNKLVTYKNGEKMKNH